MVEAVVKEWGEHMVLGYGEKSAWMATWSECIKWKLGRGNKNSFLVG